MHGDSVGELLAIAQRVIDRLDAQYMLSHLLGISRASLIAHPDRILSSTEAATFLDWINQRADGKPVAQLLGVREFYGRVFGVDQHVLIPRAETEILVEQALARIFEQKRRDLPAEYGLSILDLGTGSGAVAITLKLEVPDATVTGVDVSAAALRRARANAATLNAAVTFVEGSWYSPLADQRAHLIVANPPYVRRGDPHLAQGDLRFEPIMALTDQSDDGLASIRTIVAGASQHLMPNGWLLIEHGYDQALFVRDLMTSAGLVDVESTRDLSAIERVTAGRRKDNVSKPL
ncbi:MAG: peptide chain release factor N(5)-glutamine methyltransferase [Rhodocyclaceae bacterium]|nr:peptide chain release factor N(5)-glutamine methyltransferase [Rhodocyclaceae bacterium]MCA3024192.1 peptide chain release factor N(5)-glutamine methyltransferase [Rhodocyclaceae bacterium]MCA3030932.1 peptide chain release factor N(5)-glutamine methyltransferase [Rhodocyclaceae bacterium]MCA3037236.1 peptide chain release factor N(5)-glutamine methyltransferase [Rhodocyclaceae bacterium]MCA3044796.1 peptide chain release factor N(5)-glutamine methyltransferase [Rhodocyclaceae bacterium]